ncbi:MAG: CHAT domain-containing protein, partial [Oscillatoria sp. PMC 1068.18]|nr:CHAT domain-containing protein [Oscillatoria sp. PMC 1068.18]
CQRIKGSRAQNLESAIAACNNALDVYTREAFPEYWADAQIILANAYCQRIKGSRAQNLESAIAAYTSALSVYTREAFPEQWAMTQNNLAIAYSNRIFGSRAENIEKAIAAYTSALSVYTREAFPEDWAMTQNNLANAYQNRIRGSRAKNLESAIRGYRAALEIRTPTAYPINCLTTGRNLGNLGYNNDNWELAIEGYTPAIAAVEQSRDWATSPDTKQKLIEDALGVYNRLIQAYLQTNQLQPALKTVERSKSRYLVELLNNAELFPKNATAAQKQQLRQLRREIATLEQTLAQDGSDANISPETDSDSRSHSQPATSQQPTNPNREELQTKLHQLNQLLDEIGDDEFNLTQRVEIDFNLATLLDTETAILEWYIGESRFYTFIITHDSIHCLEHSESDLEKLIAWGNTYLNDYGEKSWNSALAPRLTALSEILNLSQVLEKIPATCSKLILIPHRYLHLFPLHALPVNASCHSQLICYSEPKRPSSFSQSNIAFSVAESDHKNLYLLDCFGGGVSYAPSCQLLQLLQTRKRPDAPKRPFFAIQNPTEDLRYTDIEVETIEKKFDPRYILKRKEANKLAFDDATTLENLRRSYYAHFSCHGAFNPESPLDSALILAGAMEMQAEPGVEVPPRSEETSDSGEMQAEPGVEVPPQSEGTSGEREVTLRDGRKAKTGESLTLREIFAKLELPGCRLVTLSACETGLISFDKLTDEYIGLPSGFLYAGSTNVVSSLWCVDDFATAFLMIRFYENLSTASSITLALNQAQMWLRDATQRELQNWVETLRLDATSQNTIQEFFSWIQPELKPFSEPQYWAAFCAIGQ